MPPTVQNLQDLIAQYQTAYAPQSQQLDTQITSNDNSGAAQESGLSAQKDQAFGQIGQQSQNNGMFFSGFTPDEEAKYTATTYLPALANLQSTIANTRNTLLGQKATLSTNANTNALTTQQQQQSQLDSYNQAQAQQAFQAQQAALDRQQQLKIAQMSAASSGAAKAPSAAAVKQQSAAQMSTALQQAAGRDGYVSPQSYSQAKNAWTGAGYSGSEFDQYFSGLANPADPQDYGLKK